MIMANMLIAALSLVHFALPASPLSEAVRGICRSAECEVLYSWADVAELRSPGLYGEYTAVRAMEVLLENTPLTFQQMRPNVFLVVPRRVVGSRMEAPVGPTEVPAQGEIGVRPSQDRRARETGSAGWSAESLHRTRSIRKRRDQERGDAYWRGRRGPTHDGPEAYMERECVCARSAHGVLLGPWCWDDQEELHTDPERCPAG